MKTEAAEKAKRVRDSMLRPDVAIQETNWLMVRGIGAAIRHERLLRGYTVVDVAERAGVSLSTLTKLEASAHSPTLDTLTRVCNVFSLSLPELLQTASRADPEEGIIA